MKRALLVIDVQKIYSEESSEYCVENVGEVVANINRLIDSFKKKNELIIYVRHEHNPDGSDSGRMFDFTGEAGEVEFQKGSVDVEFIDGLTVVDGSPIVTKTRYDSFIGTNLEQLLKQNDIERTVICGFMSNFCCESTARHAHDLDYYVDYVSDATGTPGTEQFDQEHTIQATVATLETGFATIVSTSDLI